MPIAKAQAKTFTPVPAGNHVARAIHCLALGTQTDTKGTYLPSFKIQLAWEIPDEVITTSTGEQRPMIISKEYSLSLGKKANLRRDFEGWRGRDFTPEELKGFEIANVLDKTCLLNVVHKTSATGNVYAVVASISQLPKGTICKPRVHDLLHYEIEQGTSCEVWNKIPQFIQNKIKVCEEWLNPSAIAPTEPEPEEDEGSDVPFN